MQYVRIVIEFWDSLNTWQQAMLGMTAFNFIIGAWRFVAWGKRTNDYIQLFFALLLLTFSVLYLLVREDILIIVLFGISLFNAGDSLRFLTSRGRRHPDMPRVVFAVLIALIAAHPFM